MTDGGPGVAHERASHNALAALVSTWVSMAFAELRRSYIRATALRAAAHVPDCGPGGPDPARRGGECADHVGISGRIRK